MNRNTPPWTERSSDNPTLYNGAHGEMPFCQTKVGVVTVLLWITEANICGVEWSGEGPLTPKEVMTIMGSSTEAHIAREYRAPDVPFRTQPHPPTLLQLLLLHYIDPHPP